MSGILKEFVEHLEQRTAPNIIEHMGRKYSDKDLSKIPNSVPSIIEATTLKAITDYILQGVDRNGPFAPERFVICVESPTSVTLTSEINTGDGARWPRVIAKAITPNIEFGRWMDTEMFNITLQSKFVDEGDRAAALSVVSNITDGVVTEHQDDGVTQKVNIKAGVQRVGIEAVPNPVMLAPYRTFPEVAQPTSPFVLRVKGGSENSMPTAALFEADGAQWRLQAIEGIKEYFEVALATEDEGRVVILA